MPDYMYQLESRLSAEAVGRTGSHPGACRRFRNESVSRGGSGSRSDFRNAHSRPGLTIEGNPSRIVRELEKGGAQITGENEAFSQRGINSRRRSGGEYSPRHGKIFMRIPDQKMEVRFSTIMEDLRRRDFSINAIAISTECKLSRLAARSHQRSRRSGTSARFALCPIRSFTNQPTRLLRALRYAARNGFQDGFAHGGVVQAWARTRTAKTISSKTPPTNCGNRRARKNRRRSEKPGNLPS